MNRHRLSRWVIALVGAVCCVLALGGCSVLGGLAGSSPAMGVTTAADGSKSITLPGYLFASGNSAQQLVDSLSGVEGTQAIRNADGSYTLTVSAENYAVVVEQARVQTCQLLDGMANSASYPGVSAVSYNDDLTQVQLTMAAADTQGLQMLYPFVAGIVCCMDQTIADQTVSCTVTSVTADGTQVSKTVLPDDFSLSL